MVAHNDEPDKYRIVKQIDAEEFWYPATLSVSKLIVNMIGRCLRKNKGDCLAVDDIMVLKSIDEAIQDHYIKMYNDSEVILSSDAQEDLNELIVLLPPQYESLVKDIVKIRKLNSTNLQLKVSLARADRNFIRKNIEKITEEYLSTFGLSSQDLIENDYVSGAEIVYNTDYRSLKIKNKTIKNVIRDFYYKNRHILSIKSLPAMFLASMNIYGTKRVYIAIGTKDKVYIITPNDS